MSQAGFATTENRIANVVGLGLLGGSAALALGELGFTVHGVDIDSARSAEALKAGVVDSIGTAPESLITVVAVPVDAVVAEVERALAETSGWVTDTGSVKGDIAAAIDDSRFVPSHPMAGSEQSGLGGASASLFRGAAWVVTPNPTTSDQGFAFMHDLIVALGADPITLAPDEHDRIVAIVSHVPHLAAAALMNVASRRSDEHLAMKRLAAGGFRDMTRIAAGSPEIWPPICAQNSDAIAVGLGQVIDALTTMKEAVESSDTEFLRTELAEARTARVNLPTKVPLPPDLAEVRVRITDRRGELAAITGLAAELDVNIFDLEIAHSAEGPTGVIVLLVDAAVADHLRGGLLARGYRPSVRILS